MATYRTTSDPRDALLLALPHVGQRMGVPVRKIGGSVWTIRCVPGVVTKVDGLTAVVEYELPTDYRPS